MKGRTSSPGIVSLEDGQFYSKERKPWSWSRIKRTYARQPSTTRIAIAISGGLFCFVFMYMVLGRIGGSSDSASSLYQDSRTVSRRERIKDIMCNPNITHSLPLAPQVLSNGTHEFDPTVIVISFDGLRPEYLTRGITPNILSVGANGVQTEFMKPSFPTLTFPNHHTIVTGLYPSSHGIVANMFYDPDLGEDFNYGIPNKSWNPKWWGGESIWESAVNQGQRSGVIMWPGGEVMKDVRPTYHERYRSQVSAQQKVDITLDWLDKPREERPTIIMVYINEVDSVGHDFGPEGKKSQKALAEIDNALGSLLSGIEARSLDDVVNLVLVSDHGMAYVNDAKCIYYDDYIDTSDLMFEESFQPHLAIWTKDPKKQDEIYHTLKRVQQRDQLPFQVYKREEIPARFNFNHNSRIPPVIALADPGYVLTRRDMGLAVAGVHGWDPEMEDMRAVFLASGPSFPNQGPEKLQAIENVELHDIIARTIGLQAKESVNDGVRNGFLSKPC